MLRYLRRFDTFAFFFFLHKLKFNAFQMEHRGLKTTGFPDTDREILQKAFDEEFKNSLEEARAKRRENRRRAAQQAGLQKRRMLMERTLQEEQDELARNHQVAMMIELIKENMVEGSIRMDVNSISARSLAKSMWTNSTITCLDLSSNQLNDHSGAYLARILKKNNSLKKIELDNNLLGPHSCMAFGNSLKVNTSLIFLSLDSNPITAGGDLNGIKTLAEALRVNKYLTTLNLWRTGITSAAGTTLASCIEDNDSLLFCDIGHNLIDMSDVKRITDKMDANLAAFEARERIRRDQAISEEERQRLIREAIEVKTCRNAFSLLTSFVSRFMRIFRTIVL